MDESKWTCERCGQKYDLEMGEGWVLLSPEIRSPDEGIVNPVEPYEAVCHDCADVLYNLVENCDRGCEECAVPRTWRLSVKECLQFQMKFGLLKLRVPRPKGKVALMGCLCDAKVVLEQFGSYWESEGVEWVE
jgi:hypothetical protein